MTKPQLGMSYRHQPIRTSTSLTDEDMLLPRSPRPLQPHSDYRSRLRPKTHIFPVKQPRTLNPVNFPLLADILDQFIESGITLENSDSEDSEYEQPSPAFHREGSAVPEYKVKFYNDSVAATARELEMRPLSPVSETDMFDWVVLDTTSQSEVESDAELDSPSRQLREELSQVSQVESLHTDQGQEDEEPLYLEVVQFITGNPPSNSKDDQVDTRGSAIGEPEVPARPLKRQRRS